MTFLQQQDLTAVCDARTMDVIAQSDDNNKNRAESYAIEEISSYMRSRYNIAAAFATRGAERNSTLVMITADITIYHLITWLPSRLGFEVRERRYQNAIAWCKGVQDGKLSPMLPPITSTDGTTGGNQLTYGTMKKSTYDY